jgi:pyruvate/2-oxoglutarate dehydrogenase complex dihydrolipoamide dehydrogenase (E3) component
MKRDRKAYDFAVIGGGSAGFNAARVAAEQGLRTAVIDGASELGGLCILRGCMPSKTLLYMTEVLHLAQQAKTFGLRIPLAEADLAAMQRRKRRIIADFASYRERALHGGKFDLVRAHARFRDPHTLELSNGRTLRAQRFLIGTGSRVSVPPLPGLAAAKTWTSDEVLNLSARPKSVIVLGGGVVACELAQFLGRIGTRVTIIQRSAHLLRHHSPEAGAVVAQAMRDEGIAVFTGTEVKSITQGRDGTTVTFAHGKRTVRCRADHLLNALGREPNTGGLNLEGIGVRTAASGRILTNRWQQTSLPHIYAGGDCASPAEVVHIAVQQGELAARHAAGVRGLKPVDYSLLLNVVFTSPQVASLGRSEAELKRDGVAYVSASYPFNDHGKSILMEANYGFVKVCAEPRRGRLLGVEIVGQDAGELIHAFTGPMAMRATVHDLLRAPWYHPTLAEIVTYPLEEIAESIA